jgi:hypothetical protein
MRFLQSLYRSQNQLYSLLARQNLKEATLTSARVLGPANTAVLV